ncbi:nuclear pore complex protein Nup93-like [Aphis gossypii]|uniref:nuclear pore complex protein Nup93-like n=1 Tax=Aphis gossypii TaxID=80765 RepID=UPI002158CECE|nr:nuclear pore complex protein Nup93-like [Aphis gossypii]
MAGNTDWNSIVMTAEKLQANAITDTGMPSVTRNIRQLLDAAENLWTKVGVPGVEAKGNVFLCSRGVDAPQVPKQLEKLSSAGSMDTLDPKPDMDVDSFVKNEVQNAILSLIESVKKSNEDFIEKRQSDATVRGWRNKKINIINSFPGYVPNPSSSPGGSSVMPSVAKLNTTNFGLGAQLDQTELAYAKHLCEYNQHVEHHGVQTDILQSFATAAEIAHDDRVNEMWKIVKCMSQIVPEHGSKYARSSAVNQNTMIANARTYLEQRYIVFMKSYVKSHMSKAKLGGIPGTYPLVRSFVSVYINQYNNPDKLFYDGVPFWPLVYYLIRCGDLESVIQILEKNNQDPVLLNVFTSLRNNHNYVNLNDQGFSASMAWDSNDPFKKVIYSLVSAVDVSSKHSDVIKTADDYLWLKLCQVRNDQDKLTYPVLQSMIYDEYKDQFSDVQPMSYFQLLFLTGQFESAIQFIFRHPKLCCHAIHVSIVLNEMGLLYLPSDFNQPILSKDDNQTDRLNIARMMKIYCAKFENQDLKMAINYYYCLRHIEFEGTTLFISYVAGLVIETDEYDKVFGYLKPDGKKQNGILDSFILSETQKMDIIRTTASLAEQKCDLDVSAKLYELVGQYDKVLELANIMLSRIIQPDIFSSLDKTPNTKNKVFDYIEILSQRLAGVEINVTEEAIFTFNMLKSVFVFFEQYNNHKYTLAFDVLQTIGLIPLAINQVEERLSSFKKYNELILRIIPGVMTATMNMLYSQYSDIKKESKKSARDPEQMHAQLEYIREKAKAITSFTGRVPFQINSEIINHLVQTEILLY